MSLFESDKERRILPRWRDFRTTVETGELTGAPGPHRVIDDGGFLVGKLQAWEERPSVETAAEVASAALVTGRRDDAVEAAARFLLAPGSRATAAVQSIADRVLTGVRDRRAMDEELEGSAVERKVLRLQVHALRGQLVEMPRNPLLWVDLARLYAALGQGLPATRAMDRALRLASTNRFVLRSSARLFAHLDEPDRADDMLRRQAITRKDPWVLATQIAVSTVAGRSSPFIKIARQMLESSKHPPSHLAELASAVGTIELGTGTDRSARRLFRQSLADPNENAVAQASWAARRLSGLEVRPELLEVRRSFEARAFTSFHAGEWGGTLRQAEQWLLDESFSSRPPMLASYVAMVGMNYQLAEQLARRGLLANPQDPGLLNNLVVALVEQGSLLEAEKEFAKISQPIGSKIKTAVLATEGLLHFRRGDIQSGRILYRRAIEGAADEDTRVRATLHLAREEVLAGTPDAQLAVRQAVARATRVERLDIRQMVATLEMLLESQQRVTDPKG